MGTLLSTRWLQKEAPPGSRHTLLEADGVCEWFPGPLICPENRLSLAPAPWVSSAVKVIVKSMFEYFQW